MSYTVDLSHLGLGVRPLNEEERLAYKVERAIRAIDAADGDYDEADRAFILADDALYSYVGPEGYAAARAFADQYFDRITAMPRQTVSERVYDLARGVRG